MLAIRKLQNYNAPAKNFCQGRQSAPVVLLLCNMANGNVVSNVHYMTQRIGLVRYFRFSVCQVLQQRRWMKRTVMYLWESKQFSHELSCSLLYPGHNGRWGGFSCYAYNRASSRLSNCTEPLVGTCTAPSSMGLYLHIPISRCPFLIYLWFVVRSHNGATLEVTIKEHIHSKNTARRVANCLRTPWCDDQMAKHK